MPQTTPCPAAGTKGDTFAADHAARMAEEEANGAELGVAAADLGLSSAYLLTKGLRVPSSIDLGAIKFVGTGVTALGTAYSGYQAFYGKTSQERNLARQDVAFTAFGAAFPETLPFVTLPYSAGRFARGIYDAATATPSVLDKMVAASAGCH